MTRSVLIYANCQGEELMLNGRYVPSLAGEFTFKWIPAHKVAAGDWDTLYGPEFMRDVVVLWEQMEGGQATAHRTALYERLPPGCEVVKFSPMTALFMWPFSGNDPRIAADPDRYPWPDSMAAVLSTERLGDDALFDKYLELTASRMPDLDRRLRLDAARWRQTDEMADIKVADWIEGTFRTTKLFHTSGHITAAASGPMFKQLLQRTQGIDRRRADLAIAETDALLRHHQGQDFECVPIHPLVAERLGLTWYDPDALYRWHGHEWTFKEYILRYIRWAPYLD